MSFDRARARRFVLDAFSKSEFRDMVSDEFADLEPSIHWDQGFDRVASEVIAAIERRGLLARFREVLGDARALRREEVDSLWRGDPPVEKAKEERPPVAGPWRLALMWACVLGLLFAVGFAVLELLSP